MAHRRGENVRVVCRFRPVSDDEKAQQSKDAISDYSLLIEEKENLVAMQRSSLRAVTDIFWDLLEC